MKTDIDKINTDIRNAMLNAVRALTIANQQLLVALKAVQRSTPGRAKPKLRVVK